MQAPQHCAEGPSHSSPHSNDEKKQDPSQTRALLNTIQTEALHHVCRGATLCYRCAPSLSSWQSQTPKSLRAKLCVPSCLPSWWARPPEPQGGTAHTAGAPGPHCPPSTPAAPPTAAGFTDHTAPSRKKWCLIMVYIKLDVILNIGLQFVVTYSP